MCADCMSALAFEPAFKLDKEVLAYNEALRFSSHVL